jgi:hypothetical protein
MRAPTVAGVFGMARITGVPGARAPSSVASVTPAAIDSTRSVPTSATAAHTAGTSPGFTASSVPCDGAGSPTTDTPGSASWSASVRAASFSTTRTSAAAVPDRSSPPTRASPIFPPPMTWSTAMAGNLPSPRPVGGGAVERSPVPRAAPPSRPAARSDRTNGPDPAAMAGVALAGEPVSP